MRKKQSSEKNVKEIIRFIKVVRKHLEEPNCDHTLTEIMKEGEAATVRNRTKVI